MITNLFKPLTSIHLLIQVQNYSTKSFRAHKRGTEVPRLLVKEDFQKQFERGCIKLISYPVFHLLFKKYN